MSFDASTTAAERLALISADIAALEVIRLELALESGDVMPLDAYADYAADSDDLSRAERLADEEDLRDDDETMRSLRGGR